MQVAMNRFSEKCQTFWQMRAPRERQLIAAAVAVVVGGVLYAGVYDPAAQGITKLTMSLPQTQMQAAQAEQLSAHISAQVTSTGSAKADYASNKGVDASLQAAGMGATQATSATTAPFVVTVHSASGEQLWAWLRAAPVSSASFKRGANGAWQGTATVVP